MHFKSIIYDSNKIKFLIECLGHIANVCLYTYTLCYLHCLKFLILSQISHFQVVHKLGGYNRVTNQNQWKTISHKLGSGIVNLVKQAYKK